MSKVSVYIDDEVWERFRRFVFEKHGSFRSLSKELSQTLLTMLSSDVLSALGEKFGRFLVGVDRESARRDRPENPLSSAELVREVRGSR